MCLSGVTYLPTECCMRELSLDNVSEWSDISTHGLLYERAITIQVQLIGLIQSQYHHHQHHLFEMQLVLSMT